MTISGYPFKYSTDDVRVAIQAAMQMAERFGVDMALLNDLSVTPLWSCTEPQLEIIRCPAPLKRNRRQKSSRW